MAGTIKVLIVDDSSFMRNILSRIISKDARFEVVGKAVNGKEGVQMAKTLSPDIITMDIEMPEMDGLTALDAIMKECPTRVVMISSLTKEGATATLDAMEKGAVDFIPKQMEGGANNIVSSGNLLMEKLFAASQIRLNRARSMGVLGGGLQRSTVQAPKPVNTVDATRTPAPPTRPQPTAPTRPAVSTPLRLNKVSQAKVCVIGASTGGPRALQMIIPLLPNNLRTPIVIAQHMPANFTGPMAERLDASCPITVKEGVDGMRLDPGVVYIAPGGVHTRVVTQNGGLALSVKEDQGGECVYRPSVDILAQSAADCVGGSVIAFMLTGMGADGKDGFNSLKNKGAYIVAQDEASSVVYGMPKAVAPIADEEVGIENMAEAIKRLVP